jgi:plasmid stabilization system protein ParE
MRRVIFRREGRQDVLEAYRWYERQRAELGVEFRDELEAVLDRIVKTPEAYPVVHRETRRARLRRFPYGVFYRVLDDAIVVIAVMHARRDPSSWKRR